MNVSKQELDLGVGLMDKLSADEFHPENYKDEYRIRVSGMLDKSKGNEIVIDPSPAPQRGQ